MGTSIQDFAEELNRNGVFLRNQAMPHLYQQAGSMGASGVNILIHGESGTGKDHLAKYIHNKGPRRRKPFIHLNCSTIPDELFESEFFGYEAGAFSSALRVGKPGLAELADGGTLYLDEIGELSFPGQVKLLHFLESKKVTRLGGRHAKSIDLHIISATNRDLRESIHTGQFRSDLYYRIRTIEVDIPPLRQRPDDISALIEHFMAEFGGSRSFSKEALNFLLEQPWAGNVRELLNFLEKASILEDEGIITLDMLTGGKYRFSSLLAPAAVSRERAVPPGDEDLKPLRQAVAEFERDYILQAIRSTSTLTEAAQRLGIDLATLNRKKRLLGIYKRKDLISSETG